MTRVLKSLIGLVLLIWAAARWAFGYIDPNTGGMLFQLLAVLFAVFSAFILFFSRQIRIWIARASRFVRGLFVH
jgi:hypothetical protein